MFNESINYFLYWTRWGVLTRSCGEV